MRIVYIFVFLKKHRNTFFMKRMLSVCQSIRYLFVSILLWVPITTIVYAKNITILTYPFKNLSEKEYSWIGTGISATATSDLSKIAGVTVITEQDRQEALRELSLNQSGIVEEENQLKVGEFLSADVIFAGDYQVMGDDIRVNVRLVHVEKGTVDKSIKIDGTTSSIFELQDKIVLNLITKTEKIDIADLGSLNLGKKLESSLKQTKRPNLKAYEFYAKGMQVRKRDPEKALYYYNRSKEIGEELGLEKTRNYAYLMRSIGRVHEEKKDWGKTLDYYNQSKAIIEDLGLDETRDYARLIGNIGTVYRKKGNLNEALYYYNHSKEIAKRLSLENTRGYARLMLGIGSVYKRKGNRGKARLHFQIAHKILEDLGLKRQHKMLRRSINRQ